MKFSRNMRRMS